MALQLRDPVDMLARHEPLVTPWDYQEEALDRVASLEADGHKRLLIVLPTGTGKTVVFGWLVRLKLEDGCGRALVLAHRDELIEQAAAKLGTILPRHMVGVVKAGRDEASAPVVVASVQTLARRERRERIGRFGLVVVDEAHHAPARTYRDILDDLGAFEGDGPLVVGVTATPKRGDRVGLDGIFEAVAYEKGLAEMVALGHLAPLRPRAYQLVAAPGAGKMVGGDYDEGWLGEMLLGANAPTRMVEAWRADAEGRLTIAFTPTVSVAKATAAAFTGAGIPAGWISGAMPIGERRDVLAAFHAGELRVVANCAVLTEGFDEPAVSCVIVGRPTTNPALYLQMVGRGTRKHPGKSDCLILDMVGVSGQIGLDDALGIEGEKAEAKRRAADEEARRQAADIPFRALDGTLVGADAPLFGRPIARWADLGGGWYALRLIGSGWLTLEPDARGGWTVARRDRRAREVIASDLSLEWAQGTAEGVARREGKLFQMGAKARWLDRPISAKQLGYGRSIGLDVSAATTAWQFTELLARREVARWR